MDFKALFLGYAIGDAFGAGVEFQDRYWIQENVDFTKLVNARATIVAEVPDPHMFTEHYFPWDYSDDTEMTLGLTKALMSGLSFTEDLLLDYWRKEYELGISEKGFGRNGHGSMRWVYSGEKSIAEVRQFQANRAYPGNAAPMRAIPLGFVANDEINDYAIINSDATHPHPKSRAASILIAQATAYLLVQRTDPQELIPYCLAQIVGIDEETSQLLQTIDKLPPPDAITENHYNALCGPQPIISPWFPVGIKGLPSDVMFTGGAVLFALKHFTDAFQGLQFAIRLGGDVDTAAAIVTGILSARYGLDSIPEYMLTQVEGIEMLENVAKKFEDWYYR